jgi:aspartyl/asparaginyl beta-hydroxylase (cupin superfamily)
LLGRRDEEIAAIEKALELEPRHLSALLQKGQYLEQSGELRSAARTYQNVLACLPAGTEPPPAIRAALNHAKAVVDADLASLTASMEQPLAAIREKHGGPRQRRADMCLDTLLGKRKTFYSQPTWMYFPELPAIEFFERADVPWLDAVDSASEEIRAELMRVLVSDREGLQPYIDFPSTLPLDQWRDLNRSRRWSAYYLWNQGTADAGHLARCPATARVLERVPRPMIESRAPTAFFSILEPKTKIPPHTGVTNTRMTVHLPLIIPEGCAFRVGSTTREWVPGQAWVFDDTIEHEAWNDSDTPRAILIFDIWNPLLTAAERDMIQTATELYVRHYALPPESIR